MNNEYISVLMIQAKINVNITSISELAIFDKYWYAQFQQACELIKKYKPDIALFPETFYNPIEEIKFQNLNKYCSIVIAGSTYLDGENYTVVFKNGEKYETKKNNPSPIEVAANFTNTQTFDDLYENGLDYNSSHTFFIKDKKIIILNCMEYYNSAHLIARYSGYNKNLFGIFCPCSSNNIELFTQESVVIHNHKENIYTFLCNRISPFENSTTKGNSYIYGPISRPVKKFLENKYPENCSIKHLCGIAKLKENPSYLFGEFLSSACVPFGRSDNYLPTQKNLVIENLL